LFVVIALLVLAGPGAAAVCILLAGRVGGNPLGPELLIGIIALSLAISVLIFSLSGALARLMGPGELFVLGRLLVLLLAALAVR
jgi:small neutral amino acid transporter SnatA (MarC family)